MNNKTVKAIIYIIAGLILIIGVGLLETGRIEQLGM